jgi:hypothetical protein
VLVAVSLLTTFMAVFVPAALAADEWCEDDPGIFVQTLGGHKVMVHVSDFGQLTGVAAQDQAIRKAVAAANVWYIADERLAETQASTKGDVPGTRVTIYVQIPGAVGVGSFAVQSMAGSKPHASDLAGRSSTLYMSGRDVIPLSIWLADR